MTGQRSILGLQFLEARLQVPTLQGGHFVRVLRSANGLAQ